VTHGDLEDLPYKLLRLLYRRAGDVVSKDEVATALYGGRDGITDNRIDAIVTRLRQKIEPNPKSPRFLQTVPRRGYRLMVEPEDSSHQSTSPTHPAQS
jgi:DNA-binding winged helix-turn-helix (wHTH) protein